MAIIGFIGVGNMGGPMAANLAKAGHTVKAFDLSKEAVDKVVAAGCEAAETVTDAARGVDVIITMLPAGKHVAHVYDGADGVFATAAPGTLMIDCSTIDVDTARTVINAAEEKGFLMVDAPVSGGVGGAEAGTLTFMVGGSEEAVEKARPFLDIMGKTVVHAGRPATARQPRSATT